MRYTLIAVALFTVVDSASAQTADLCTKARNYEAAGYSTYWSRSALAQCPSLPVVAPPAQVSAECVVYAGLTVVPVNCAMRESAQQIADAISAALLPPPPMPLLLAPRLPRRNWLTDAADIMRESIERQKRLQEQQQRDRLVFELQELNNTLMFMKWK